MPAHPAPPVSSPNQSLFFKRLEAVAATQADNTKLKTLCLATSKLLESAKAISKQVALHLPQFTLHDDVHLWNVLSFMEELAGGEPEIQKLEAGDCAMAIWAAFCHDLGMVLEAGELALLDAVDHYDASPVDDTAKSELLSDERAQAWRAYRDGHEHWSLIRQDPQSAVNRMRLGIIRAAYIRDSHAREDAKSGHCRIADWLKFLADSDRLLEQTLEDFTVADRLVRVAVSHNQDIQWLPRQLRDQLNIDGPQAEFMCAELGTVHWTWIGWLLRLADVFDCDKSRTPKILFEHAGITDARSQTEWQKHLAIGSPPTWAAGNDNRTLLYTCQRCPSPVVEKAIHQIIGWMNDEIVKVQGAQLATTSAPSLPHLNLPSRAVIDIKHRVGGYLYHDMEFRLDRDAVVELLMGESLYGGPELALRELVQNALDAVHLRDQRNQLAIALKKAGGIDKPRQPHEPWEGEEPGVEVTWGFDKSKNRNFVRVSDNGVGMTVETMRRFLTQIGKSYYKSDDFRAEQELMRRNGILCTAISQFGIGFLSAFMLADEVTIHTRPVGVNHEKPPADGSMQENARFPFRAEIHGPHGLLVFYPDNSIHLPGTTVTIWLKEKFVLAAWDRELLLARLRKEFYEREVPESLVEQLKQDRNEKPRQQFLDPGFEISRFIVWPLYPVKLSAESQTDSLVIDDSFHHRELIPLKRKALKAKAEEWNHTIPEIDQTDWCVCDWSDRYVTAGGVEGTGTRIRLIAAQPEGNSKRFTPAEWASFEEYLPSGESRLLLGSFTESQLPPTLTRYQCLVNGVRIVPGYVPSRSERDCQLSHILENLPMLPGAGGWIWIDLRGAAMPRLRADRSAPVASQAEHVDWTGLWQRWQQSWPTLHTHWLGNCFMSSRLWRFESDHTGSICRLGLSGVSPCLVEHLLHTTGVALRHINGNLRRDPVSLVSDVHFLFGDRSYVKPRDHGLANVLANALANALALARVLSLGYTHYDHDIAIAHAYDLVSAWPDSNLWRSRLIAEMIRAHSASEAVGRAHSESHPAIGWPTDARLERSVSLVGPLRVAWDGDVASKQSWLAKFDLVMPYTAVPTRGLQKKVSDFFEHRYYRAIFMLPFLYGQEPFDEWREVSKEYLTLDSMLLFLPNPDHWEWLFDEHTREEWAQGSASALWDLKSGEVLYADGIHNEQSIRQSGKPLLEWLHLPQ